MKYFLSFLLIVISAGAYAQAVECPLLVVTTDAGVVIPNGGTDTLPCGPSCVTMNAAIIPDNIQGTSTYSVTSVAYAPESFTLGTNVTYLGAVMATSGSTDDMFGDIIDLPFSFCFFGTSYNQIVVGSNGNATFNTALANSYDPWPISGPMPGSNCNATYQCIMAPWNDLEDFATPGASVTWNVYGVAPCRQFVVSWNNDQLFDPGSCPGQNSTQQFILYEQSNIIDIYIQHRAPCVSWNNGFAVAGIENAAGTTFYSPPGENGTTFTATDLGWRFTPSSPITWTYAWKDSTGATIGSTDSVVLCPSNTSRYSVSLTSSAPCPTTFTSNFTIVKKSGLGIRDTGSTNPSYCRNTGAIFFQGIPTGDSVMASYTYNGVAVGPTLIFPDVDSTITYTGLPGGIYDSFLFVDKGCIYGPYDFNLVPHPMSAGITVNANAVCFNAPTPITFIGSTTNIDVPTFTWNFGDGTPLVTTPASDSAVIHTFPISGFFTATLTVTDTFGCDSMAFDTTDVIQITVHTGVHDTSVCLVDSMPLVAYTHVNFPFIGWNYSWMPINNIGLDSTYTPAGGEYSTSVTNFFGVGTFTYSVTVTTTSPVLVLNPNGCAATDTETIISYPPVTLIGVTASPQTVAVGGSIYLNASGAVYYNWTPDNGTLNNTNINNPLATPTDSTTIYTVYGMNDYGCKDSATVTVRLDNTTYQSAPSAFTPNGDGLNDVFKITPLKYQKLVEMRIFNRWGQAVFYTNNPDKGWDGTFNGVPQDMGTYSYEIIIGLPEGTNQVYKGTLTLLR